MEETADKLGNEVRIEVGQLSPCCQIRSDPFPQSGTWMVWNEEGLSSLT